MIMVHVSFPGIVKRAYFPAFTFVPPMITLVLKSIVVASLAPVRQTESYGTRLPHIVRPLTPGLWYSIFTLVSPKTWLTLAAGLAAGRVGFCANALIAIIVVQNNVLSVFIECIIVFEGLCSELFKMMID